MPHVEAKLGSPAGALTALLAELRHQLDLPLPARTRVFEELADDAEALYAELRRRGWSEHAATARVREVVIPEGPARDALRELHATLYQRIAHRFSPEAMRRWERIALGTLAFTTTAIGAAALRGVPLFHNPSPFLAPVMGLGAAGLLIALVKCFQLFIKGVHDTRELQAGLAPLLGISVVTTVAAIGGVMTDLRTLAARMEAAYDPSGRLVLAFIRADGTLLTVGLMASLALGLGWFLLLQWVSAIQTEERTSFQRRTAITSSAGGNPC